MVPVTFSRTIVALGLLFMGTANSFAGTTLERIKQTGVVNLGFREDSLPFSYKNTEQGAPLGYSIDVCNALVDALKTETGKSLTVKYVPVSSAARVPFVVDGKIDFECGNSTNTKARREKVAFSMPLYFASARMLVREGSGIAKFNDLAGKTLAVEKGSTGEQIAEARKSVFYASGIIAFFFNVIAIMGLCAIVLVGTNPEFFEGGQVGGKLVGGGNMVALHLAKAAGGNLLLGFLSAVAFATILAVVAGLALAGASAISHDLYARVIMKGQASEEKEIRVSKIATLCLGVVAVLLGMAFEKMNVAFMVALAFGVASCANFPVLLMSMYWKGLTTRGALVGGYTGLISSVLFVLFSKSVWVDVLGNPAPLFPYTQPALFAMPLAFLAIYVFSKLDNSAEAQAERAAFDDQYVRAQTGVGAASAAAH